MTGEVSARAAADGPLPRFGRVRRELGDVLEHFSRLLVSPASSVSSAAVGAGRSAFARQLTMRAIRVVRAFAESAVVVVAAERTGSPTVFTVTVPSRALHLGPPGPLELSGQAALDQERGWPASGRWLRPTNWILPRASLQIDLLLPSADADRQVQVNLPDGVSPDPSRPLRSRAELDVRTEQPLPVGQLAELMGQLIAGQRRPCRLAAGVLALSG